MEQLVRGPGELERDVQPLARVLEARVRMQRDARGGGVGDHGDELLAAQEGLLLREVDLVLAHPVLGARLPARRAWLGLELRLGLGLGSGLGLG